ncbi:MAG: hypothetical protein J6J07_00385, partial [Oscillospiraceae bacterium]|nr:hypothetical protein [Oscillospiraceae bacterium]
MKLRIFMLAFSVGFVFCFSAAAFFVFNFSGNKVPEILTENPEKPVFLEEENAVFLLAFENKNGFGPFTLINFDAKAGRIPVFSFSKNAAINYGGVFLSAEALFSSVSPEVFAGTVETNLGIELAGYFIWNRESAEEIIAKTGTFDYVLPEDIKYSDGSSYVNLSSGVQNMNGKKICDIALSPKFSEAERCDTVSRMTAAFLNRRLRRFLPESSVYSTIFNYTETDVSAFDKEKYSKLIEVLSSSGTSLSGHITNDTEKDTGTGLLYFSAETKER